MNVPTERVERFVAQLESRDVAGATRLARELVYEGVPVVDVLTGLVGPAQAEVGERWQRDELSVADEHAATAISETVVAILTTDPSPPPATGPRVAVVCGEGEWHLMPARLTAEVLRAAGYDVAFLGASLPAAHLDRFLERSRPDVVAVSCSTPLSFDGVLATVEVAHDAGVPVIGGGRALGSDERRAAALGIDLWAPSAVAAADLLREPARADLRASSADIGAAAELALHRSELVAAALDALADRLPVMRSFSADQLERTREDVAYILRFAEASLLTGDPRLFDEFLRWLDELLVARGLAPGTLARSLHVLVDVSRGHERLEALLARATTVV